MSNIQDINAREILDSRGIPTLEVDIMVDGLISRASCPSGASTGTNEAVELRDGDIKRFQGKGLKKAIYNITNIIKPALIGKDCTNQKFIDDLLISLDGTSNKSVLGANSIISVSTVVLKAAAFYNKKNLFEYINPEANTLPIPLINILNGGLHADNKLDIQEFMIAPVGATSFKHSIQMASEIFQELKLVIRKKGLSISVGDEGGFAPNINSAEQAIELVLLAIQNAGYNTEKDIKLALDVASSELYKNKKYYFKGESKVYNSEELIKYYEYLTKTYPIFSIEDGLAENDFVGWELLTMALGDKIQLVGDDIFVTNKNILSKCINSNIGNSILIKPNQVGTITETIETIKHAQLNNYSCIMSHRSGETEDTLIAHLAVGRRVVLKLKLDQSQELIEQLNIMNLYELKNK